MRITRRQLLAALASVPIAGGLAATGAAWQWWDRAPGDGLRCLADDEHDFVQAFAEAWMPRGGTPHLSGADAQLGRFFDDVLSGMVHEQATELKLLLQVLDDAPRVTQFAPFRRLDLEARIAQLDAWLHHDVWLVRNGVQALLALVGTGYTIHPDVVPHLQPYFRCAYGR
jgi:hypothetical protein